MIFVRDPPSLQIAAGCYTSPTPTRNHRDLPALTRSVFASDPNQEVSNPIEAHLLGAETDPPSSSAGGEISGLGSTNNRGWGHLFGLALRLNVQNSQILLLAPVNMAFGLSTAYIIFHLNGDIVIAALGKANIGLLAAISPLTCALLSPPMGYIAARCGKLSVMLSGALVYVALTVSLAMQTRKQLEALGWCLSYVYVLKGVGI